MDQGNKTRRWWRRYGLSDANLRLSLRVRCVDTWVSIYSTEPGPPYTASLFSRCITLQANREDRRSALIDAAEESTSTS
jgi:hypothetical protein